ncbi:MAG: carbon-nitrogen hydrolase [Epsilonproteobacteria bacterium]|nr:carbon-nitrogen hydrolase [Campylobacterota bacterium]NPA89098.1 carbon-nitrogen hydrolase [Campylobacterota bacterium]
MVVTLIQQKCNGSIGENRERSLEAIKRAEGELIILPELHQTPYFCKSEDPQFFQFAENFEEDLKFWKEVSRERKKVIVVSLFEKSLPGVYYNTAIVLDRGRVAGFYRKTHIPDDPGFYEKFYFTPGERIDPIETSLGRLGVLVCWDQWYPEPARIMGLKGAEILIYPTAIGWLECPQERRDPLCEKENTPEERKKMLEAWIAVQRGHAVANGIPVVAVNRVGFEPDPSQCLGGITFWGNSFAFGAQGEELTRGGEGEEVLNVEIDLKKGEEVRKIWPFYRDRRIDLYSPLLHRELTSHSLWSRIKEEK